MNGVAGVAGKCGQCKILSWGGVGDPDGTEGPKAKRAKASKAKSNPSPNACLPKVLILSPIQRECTPSSILIQESRFLESKPEAIPEPSSVVSRSVLSLNPPDLDHLSVSSGGGEDQGTGKHIREGRTKAGGTGKARRERGRKGGEWWEWDPYICERQSHGVWGGARQARVGEGTITWAGRYKNHKAKGKA